MIKKTSILIVDDSVFFRNFLTMGLSAHETITIAGYASNAFDAFGQIEALHPDVITLDIEMPGMNGIDFLKMLLPRHPIPVILVSSLNLRLFDALAAGAVDFVRKPDSSQSLKIDSFFRTLQSKIFIAGCAKVKVPSSEPCYRCSSNPIRCPPFKPSLRKSACVVAFGASTGGTEAVLSILKRLPADFPAILITQHMPPGFTRMYAQRLNSLCAMDVKEAEDKDPLLKGRVLVAPGGLQMRVAPLGGGYIVRCLPEARVNHFLPSVDVLFTSMAQYVKSKGVGVILTGMGRDGAAGLLDMRKNGAYTIGQDSESSVIYGMPLAAYELGGVSRQASLLQIPELLIQYMKS